jgi:GTPase SAR1 family protein
LPKTVELSKKVCILGTFAAGKTSLVRRAVHGVFDEQFLTTIGVQISPKLISVLAHPGFNACLRVKLILWDLAFIDQLNDTIRNYFRGSHAAMVVYDLTRPESYDSSVEFLQAFREMNPCSPIVFAGNKTDLIPETHSNAGQFLHHVRQHEGQHAVFTSARSGLGVEEAFVLMARNALEAERS